MLSNEQAQRFAHLLADVGDRLSAHRHRHSLSLRQLAGATGLSHRAVWRVEHGLTDPRLSTLFALSESLDTTVFDLLESQWIPGPGPQRVAIALSDETVAALDRTNADLIGRWLAIALREPAIVKNLADGLREGLINAVLDAATATADSTPVDQP
jgi:transcriptional regulator with XRE-family HTH domain